MALWVGDALRIYGILGCLAVLALMFYRFPPDAR